MATLLSTSCSWQLALENQKMLKVQAEALKQDGDIMVVRSIFYIQFLWNNQNLYYKKKNRKDTCSWECRGRWLKRTWWGGLDWLPRLPWSTDDGEPGCSWKRRWRWKHAAGYNHKLLSLLENFFYILTGSKCPQHKHTWLLDNSSYNKHTQEVFQCKSKSYVTK